MKFEVRTKKPVPKVSLGEPMSLPRSSVPGTHPGSKAIAQRMQPVAAPAKRKV
jgi:hypothetical protein